MCTLDTTATTVGRLHAATELVRRIDPHETCEVAVRVNPHEQPWGHPMSIHFAPTNPMGKRRLAMSDAFRSCAWDRIPGSSVTYVGDFRVFVTDAEPEAVPA